MDNLARLRKEYPELSAPIIEEALARNGDNYYAASEALKAQYYSEDTGVAKETSFWAPLLATLTGNDAGARGGDAGGSSTDWLAPLSDGIAQVGEQILQAANAVVDALPDLAFWEDEGYYDGDAEAGGSKRGDPDQVVAASGVHSSTKMKQRRASTGLRGGGGGGGGAAVLAPARSSEDEVYAELAGKED